MEKASIGHHISKQFDAELEDVRDRVLAMGELVEKQVDDAVRALVEGDRDLAEMVIENDYKVNAQEVAIDEECTQVLARRQPAAIDLRLIVAVIKTITDLERIGDQAEKVARMGQRLAQTERPKNKYLEIQHLGDLVRQMLHHSLAAFAQLDAGAAYDVTREDENINREYKEIMRQMVTSMMEDARLITRSLDTIWAVRALERIGDHSTNICEYVIYFVKGKDIRHTSMDEVKRRL